MIIGVLLIFVSILSFICGTYNIAFKDIIAVEKRLENLKKYDKKLENITDEYLQKSFFDRIIKPLLVFASKVFSKFIPLSKKETLEKRLILAGKPWGISSTEFIVFNYAITIVTGLLGFLLCRLNGLQWYFQIVGTLWASLFGKILIDTIIKVKIKVRQNNIEEGLPDVMDLLTVSVEAGLGFDSALTKVIEKTDTELTKEFGRTLQEMRMGKSRRGALKDLADRTGVEDLNNFVAAIIQAESLGSSISNVLRIQSRQIRILRRQRIEEKAMKAPVKMLIPMVFFIFPAIFVVILGPAAIQLIQNLK